MPPWFKVSDDLPSKPETTRIPRVYRRAALGVWALAGSWSAQQLTDGHIPQHMLEELSGTEEDAAWLVTAGFWSAVDDGWQFVEWAPEQPLREVVLELRRKNAEKLKNWRSKNKPSNPVTPSVTDTVTDPVTNDVVTLPPSLSPKPDPTTSNEVEEHVHPPAAQVNSIEEEFVEFWELYPRKQGRVDALKAYKAARKTHDAASLRAGAQAYTLLNIGVDKEFLKLPAGWISGERWRDEAIVATPTATPSPTSIAPRVDLTPTCELHPEYPTTKTSPCAKCAREAAEAFAVRVAS